MEMLSPFCSIRLCSGTAFPPQRETYVLMEFFKLYNCFLLESLAEAVDAVRNLSSVYAFTKNQYSESARQQAWQIYSHHLRSSKC